MSRRITGEVIVAAYLLRLLPAAVRAALPHPPLPRRRRRPHRPPPQEEPMQQAACVVIDAIVNLYSQPTASADPVTQTILGTTVALWEARDGWYYVRLPDQYQGWIEAQHVRPSLSRSPTSKSRTGQTCTMAPGARECDSRGKEGMQTRKER